MGEVGRTDTSGAGATLGRTRKRVLTEDILYQITFFVRFTYLFLKKKAAYGNWVFLGDQAGGCPSDVAAKRECVCERVSLLTSKRCDESVSEWLWSVFEVGFGTQEEHNDGVKRRYIR